MVKAIDIASALTFQAPERLLLGLTAAGDAFFGTIGTTGDIGATLQAVGASVSMTINESLGFITHALNESVPIAAPAAAGPHPTTVAAVDKPSGPPPSISGAAVRRNVTASDVSTPSTTSPQPKTKHAALTRRHQSDSGSEAAKANDGSRSGKPHSGKKLK